MNFFVACDVYANSDTRIDSQPLKNHRLLFREYLKNENNIFPKM